MSHNIIQLNNKLFINSTKIQVFPCAYRGGRTVTISAGTSAKTTNKIIAFQPNSRAFTEENWTKFNPGNNEKTSYLVSTTQKEDNETEIKCVIGGYTFIVQLTQDDLTVLAGGASTALGCQNQSSSRYLTISLMSQKLDEFMTPSGTDLSHSTAMLASRCTNRIDTLDLAITDSSGVEVVDNDGDKFIFTGLTVEDEVPTTTNTYYLALAKLDKSGNIVWLNEANRLSTVLTTSTGEHSIQTVDVNDSSTDIIEANVQKATGKQALAFGYQSTASGDYAVTLGQKTKATNSNSTALGNSAHATGTNSVALGEYTTASGCNSVSTGKHTEVSGMNSVAFGQYTNANGNNQVVLGKYNSLDEDQTFIIGNGKNSTNRSNVLTVSSTGEMKLANGTSGQNKLNIGGSGQGTGELHVGDQTFDLDSSGNVDFRGSLKIGTKDNEELQFITDPETEVKKLNLNGSLVQTGDFTIQPDNSTTCTKICANTGTIELSGDDAEILVNANKSSNYLKITKDGKISTDKCITVNNNLSATNITASSDLTASGNLSIAGNSTFNGTVDIDSSLTATGDNIALTGATTISGNTNITGDVSIKQDRTTVTAEFTSTKIDLNNNTNITGALKVTDTSEFGGKITAKQGLSILSGATTLYDSFNVKNTQEQDVLTINPQADAPQLILNASCQIKDTLDILDSLNVTNTIFASNKQASVSSTNSKISNIQLTNTNQAIYSNTLSNLDEGGTGYYISNNSIALCPTESTRLCLNNNTASIESDVPIQLSKTKIGSITLDPAHKLSANAKHTFNSIYGVEYAQFESIELTEAVWTAELCVADLVRIDSDEIYSSIPIRVANASNESSEITLDTNGTVTACHIKADNISSDEITADKITATDQLTTTSLSVSNTLEAKNLSVSGKLTAGSIVLNYCERISFNGIGNGSTNMIKHLFVSDTTGAYLFQALGLANKYGHTILEGSLCITLASTDSRTAGGRYTGFEQTSISLPIAIHVNSYKNSYYEVTPAVIDLCGAYGQAEDNYSLVLVYGNNLDSAGNRVKWAVSSASHSTIEGFKTDAHNYLNVYDINRSKYLFAYIKKGGDNWTDTISGHTYFQITEDCEIKALTVYLTRACYSW